MVPLNFAGVLKTPWVRDSLNVEWWSRNLPVGAPWSGTSCLYGDQHQPEITETKVLGNPPFGMASEAVGNMESGLYNCYNCHLSTLSFRDRVVTSERVLNIDDGTAEFGWGPEDPVEKGQLQLLGWSRNLPVGGPFFSSNLAISKLYTKTHGQTTSACQCLLKGRRL